MYCALLDQIWHPDNVFLRVHHDYWLLTQQQSWRRAAPAAGLGGNVV
jgi:hypothetical protein